MDESSIEVEVKVDSVYDERERFFHKIKRKEKKKKDLKERKRNNIYHFHNSKANSTHSSSKLFKGGDSRCDFSYK